MSNQVLVLVGTKKGAFIMESSPARARWKVRGPYLEGQNIMHMAYDPRTSTTFAAVGDPGLVAAALGDIARAKGMAQIARQAGLGRESLYKALSPEGNPEFTTVLKVVRALGLRLHAVPAKGTAER